jgi:hypothetical protein
MATGNLPPKNIGDSTIDFFNAATKLNTRGTSSNKNDALVAFLHNWRGSKLAGDITAANILSIAESQNIDPISIIDEIMKLDASQLNAHLTIFLNLNRVGTSLLGISNTPTTNKYISRAILL